MATQLDPKIEQRLSALARTLVDDDRARVVRQPTADEPGFWYGSGGIARDAAGAYYISGRYRDKGDSRIYSIVGGLFQPLSLEKYFSFIFIHPVNCPGKLGFSCPHESVKSDDFTFFNFEG